MLPNIICGDLDSLEDDVRTFYEARGVQVIHEPDQDTTDLYKCLNVLQRQQQNLADGQVRSPVKQI
jgi:thiamine pyrophosphokinase